MRACTAWVFLAFGAAVIGASGGAARAPFPPPVLLSELPKGFDDYSPPAKSEQLPPESGQGGNQGGGTTGGGGTTRSTGGRLTHRHILGNWCSASSKYIIGRRRLTVILTSTGSRSNYRVNGFVFTAKTAAVRWTSGKNKNVRTTFGRFSADGRSMVQLAPNRTYRRCVIGAAEPLAYKHILGSWCDVNSRYIISRSRLRVVFSSGRRVNYAITGFRFLKNTVEMNWTDNSGKAFRTRFGRYTADRRGMVQLGVNRAYRRC